MYESSVNSEDTVNYNLLFCHACLSSNRTLTVVGDYVDIYIKICDNGRMNVTSQINICWECLALLKKIQAFKKKVENAQKIIEYCVNKQAPLQTSLSGLAQSCPEITTFIPILDEYEALDKAAIKMDLDEPCLKGPYSVVKDPYSEQKDPYSELKYPYSEQGDSYSDPKYLKDSQNDLKGELTIKIEDVRGRCEILDVKPVLDLSLNSSSNVVTVEPLSPEPEEKQEHRRWKRSVMLVFKRICGHPHAQHFLRPVSDALAPLYSRVVRRPADLGTIRRHIRDGTIRTTAQLERALLLMFSNALMYNSTHHDMFHMALEFRTETLRELSLLSEAQAHAASPPPCGRAGDVTPPPPPPRRRALHPPAQPRAQRPDTETAVVGRRRTAPAAVKRRASETAESQPAEPETSVPIGNRRRQWAGSLKRRRASEWAEPVKQWAEPVKQWAEPAPAQKRRSAWDCAGWDWSCLDTEHLVARQCFRKCKSTVLL